MTTEVKASKHDSEKADLSLIPRVALEAAARAFMVGEKKYGRYNFYKGHDASQLIAALLRHATAWMEGEETDPQDGQHHLGSVIACASMIMQQQKLGTLRDNRFKKEEITDTYNFKGIWLDEKEIDSLVLNNHKEMGKQVLTAGKVRKKKKG